MQISAWKCPTCKKNLFVTNSARYWCATCGQEQNKQVVDPCARDFVMVKIEMEYAFEKAMNQGVKLCPTTSNASAQP